jgi:hypothetical protein
MALVAVYDNQTVVLIWAVALGLVTLYWKLWLSPRLQSATEREQTRREGVEARTAVAERERETKRRYWAKKEVKLVREHNAVHKKRQTRRLEEFKASSSQHILNPRHHRASAWINGDPGRRDDVLGDGQCCGLKFSGIPNAYAGAREFPAALACASTRKSSEGDPGLVVVLVVSRTAANLHEMVLHECSFFYNRPDVSVWVGTLGDAVSRGILARPTTRLDVPVLLALLPLGGADYRILHTRCLSPSSSPSSPSSSPSCIERNAIFLAEAQALSSYGVERFAELNPNEHTSASVIARQDAEYEQALMADMKNQSVKQLQQTKARAEAGKKAELRVRLAAEADTAVSGLEKDGDSRIRLRIKCATLVKHEHRRLVVDVDVSSSASVYSILCTIATQAPVFDHRADKYLKMDAKQWEFGFLLRSVHPTLRLTWECRQQTLAETIMAQAPAAGIPSTITLHADES